MRIMLLTAAIMMATLPAFANDCYSLSPPEGYSFSDLEDCTIESGLITIMNEEGRYGFASAAGEVIIPPQYDEAWSFQEGFALVRKDKLWGYIRPDGSYLVKPIYTDAWGFGDGLARVQRKGKYGFINGQGKEVIAPKYDDGSQWFNEYRAAVAINNKWGVIDTTGKTIIPTTYDYASNAYSGRIVVGKKGADGDLRYGYADIHGNLVIKPTYSYASDFSRGFAYVISDDWEGYIDTYGNPVDEKVDFNDL